MNDGLMDGGGGGEFTAANQNEHLFARCCYETKRNVVWLSESAHTLSINTAECVEWSQHVCICVCISIPYSPCFAGKCQTGGRAHA